jgi:hypothetical protein
MLWNAKKELTHWRFIKPGDKVKYVSPQYGDTVLEQDEIITVADVIPDIGDGGDSVLFFEKNWRIHRRLAKRFERILEPKTPGPTFHETPPKRM